MKTTCTYFSMRAFMLAGGCSSTSTSSDSPGASVTNGSVGGAPGVCPLATTSEPSFLCTLATVQPQEVLISAIGRSAPETLVTLALCFISAPYQTCPKSIVGGSKLT